MRSLLIFFIAVTLTACATVPMASKQEDAAAKTYQVPSEKARIYVYRNELMGGAVKIPITLDGKLMGSTVKKTFFVFDVIPGTHEVGCIGETSGKVAVDAKGGEAAYVWQEMKMGMWGASCAMHISDPQAAQKALSECQLAASP